MALEDVFRLQQAVTGFRVVSHMENLGMIYDRKRRVGRTPESSRANLQIWQYKPLSATAASDVSFASFSSDTGSVMTAKRIATGLSSDTGIVDTATESVTLKRPVLPLLVLYTKIGRGEAKPSALVYLKSKCGSIQLPRLPRVDLSFCL
jgi:hypothetical protein